MGQLTSEHLKRRKAFQELAGRLYDKMYEAEEQKYLLTFTQREDRVIELGRTLQAALLEEHLQRDPAAQTGQVCCCPICKKPAERKETRAEREVCTRVGKVRWGRARYYCRHCRRHFSPSRLSTGITGGGL